jgi:hypothetical protein
MQAQKPEPEIIIDSSSEDRIDKLDKLANAMDTNWKLPFTEIRVGWDTLIGLIPGVGDTLTSLVSAYIIREAHQLGVPAWVKWRMGWNMFVDWLIGMIPLLGDIFDIGWKANKRNVELIKKYRK